MRLSAVKRSWSISRVMSTTQERGVGARMVAHAIQRVAQVVQRRRRVVAQAGGAREPRQLTGFTSRRLEIA